MGHGITGKDVVPFGTVVANWSYDDIDNDLAMMEDPTAALNSRFENSEEENPTCEWVDGWESLSEEEQNKFKYFENWLATKNFMVREWRYDNLVEIGRKKDIFAHKWVKGEHEIFLTNTSQYSNGGETECTLCANDEISAAEFMKDFSDVIEYNDPVESNYVVVTWG